MRNLSRIGLLFAAIAGGIGAATGAAHAAKPEPWGIGMQPSGSIIMDEVSDFHDFLLWIIAAITVFVFVLLAWVIIRFRESKNPEPSTTTHNTLIEVVWTLLPALILIGIAIPSFKLLYYEDSAGHELPITIKARGHQWFWSYVYLSSQKMNDQGRVVSESGAVLEWDADTAKYKSGKPVEMVTTRFKYNSRMLCKTHAACTAEKAKRKMDRQPLRLLDVTRELVIPVGVKVRLLVEGMDVIHSFAMPAMGVKVDAVPGRINETWIQAKKTGLYYGQCSEICGRDHAYMPIVIRVLSIADYRKWLEQAQGVAKGGGDQDVDGIQKIEQITPATTSSVAPKGGKRSVAEQRGE